MYDFWCVGMNANILVVTPNSFPPTNSAQSVDTRYVCTVATAAAAAAVWKFFRYISSL